jgi:acyl carrier protein
MSTNLSTLDNAASQFAAHFLSAVDFQDVVEVLPNTRLADLPEWDSLAALGVILMCDTEYGVAITGNDLKSAITVNDILELALAKKAR